MAYKAVIGLEFHCEVKSNTKVFSKSKNDYSKLANANVTALDMAFPGTLPIVNKECVRKALMMSMILNCKQPDFMEFDRKNYFYPDLPKGYQLTQFFHPVGVDGQIDIDVDGKTKTVYVHDIHLEEDAASLDHYYDTSCIDYNRAGVPLLELVTEPCLNSADEAVAFLEHVRSIYQYTDISEADSKKGQIRCDVNISLMDASLDESDPNNWGTRAEIKNVNSFGGVRDAINYEIVRQSEILDNGGAVEQETRRWDEESGTTIYMRSKVDAIDYKYFVEPNIPKFKISQEWLDEIRASIPELAMDRKKKYIEQYGLSEYDAGVIVKEKCVSDYFEECLKLNMNAKTAANWLTVQIIAYINKYEIELKDFYLTPVLLNQIITELDKGTISSKQAKEIFFKSLEENKEPKTFITKDNAQISDEGVLNDIISNILANNENQVNEYKSGKTNLFDYFVGQVMKETRGKANPNIVKEILKGKLDN